MTQEILPMKTCETQDADLVQCIKRSLQGIGVIALQALHYRHEQLRPCGHPAHTHYYRHICADNMPQGLAGAANGMQQRNLHNTSKCWTCASAKRVCSFDGHSVAWKASIDLAHLDVFAKLLCGCCIVVLQVVLQQ